MAIEHIDCADCVGGTKSYVCSNCDGNGQRYEGRTCRECSGHGEISFDCNDCDGNSEIEHEVLYLNLSYQEAMGMKEFGTLGPGSHKVYLKLSEEKNWGIHKDHYAPNFPSSPNPGDSVVICVLLNELEDACANWSGGGLHYTGEICWTSDTLWAKYGKDQKEFNIG